MKAGTMKRAVSLSNELHTIMTGVAGVRLLARHWLDSSGTGTERDYGEALASLAVLLVERLRLLDRAVRGVVDPRLVWCAENQGYEASASDERDVLLPAWSDVELVRHHRAELRRAKVRRKRAKGGR